MNLLKPEITWERRRLGGVFREFAGETPAVPGEIGSFETVT
jgi:hypothetical protein